MSRLAALPFRLTRSTDVIGRGQITSTKETLHGLLRLEASQLVVQWRIVRETDRVGTEIRTDQEVDPVREVIVPLAGVAGAVVRRSRWWPFARPRLVLTAADLRAFEQVIGEAGLPSVHPAELVLSFHASDLGAADEFVSELEGALADRALRAAEGLRELPG